MYMFTNLYDCHIKLNKAKPIKHVGFGGCLLFGLRIVFNNFQSYQDGVWLRQGVRCFIGDFSGFNTVLDVKVLSHYGIKSQPLPVT